MVKSVLVLATATPPCKSQSTPFPSRQSMINILSAATTKLPAPSSTNQVVDVLRLVLPSNTNVTSPRFLALASPSILLVSSLTTEAPFGTSASSTTRASTTSTLPTLALPPNASRSSSPQQTETAPVPPVLLRSPLSPHLLKPLPHLLKSPLQPHPLRSPLSPLLLRSLPSLLLLLLLK